MIKKLLQRVVALMGATLMLSIVGTAMAAPNLVEQRQRVSLDGEWQIIVDPLGLGDSSPFGGDIPERGYFLNPPRGPQNLVEFSFDNSQTLTVPGDWNSQKAELFFYDRTVWYHRMITSAGTGDGMGDGTGDGRKFLHFGAVNYRAKVWIDGAFVGAHEGGFTPFAFDVTDALSAPGDHSLVVKVDNLHGTHTIPTRWADWLHFGGITRSVSLVSVPAAHIEDFTVSLKDHQTKQGVIKIDVTGVTSRTDITVAIPALNIQRQVQTDSSGALYLQLDLSDATLWSPQNPQLYDVIVTLGDDEVSDRVGFRTVETRGTDILLNGEPIFLKGVAMHEESILHEGRSHGPADAKAMLMLAKELGANFIRLAHYPHDAATTRLADELGLLIWSEVPVYWQIAFEDEAVLAKAKTMIGEMIRRDANRASVVIWSIANETPESDERLAFLEALADEVRRLDNTRLVSAALLTGRKELEAIGYAVVSRALNDPQVSDKTKQALADEIGFFPSAIARAAAWLGNVGPAAAPDMRSEDPLGEFVDVVAINEYFGWYYAAFIPLIVPLPEADARRIIFDMMDEVVIGTKFDKPLIISEFGAGAKAGYTDPTAPIWSEDYQAKVYDMQLQMLERSDQLAGISPWVLRDFRSYMRPLNSIQDYYNRKGLVSETGQKKKAFFILQQYYQNRE